MKTSLIFAGSLVATLLSGCSVVDSSQVSSTTNYATYAAEYSAQTNAASYNAHFSVGGSTGTVLELDGNSKVTIDGFSMAAQEDIFNDLNYVSTESPFSPTDFQQSHEFLFVDQNGNTYKNDFTFPDLIAPVSGQSMSASLQSDFSVNWTLLGSGNYGNATSATLTRPDGTSIATNGSGGNSGTLTFAVSDLQTLGASSLLLTVCNSIETSNIQGDPDGGWLQTTSCSQNYMVNLYSAKTLSLARARTTD